MDGIFSDVNNTESKDTTNTTIESNLSPSVLKKKIENLQSGHQHLQTKRWDIILQNTLTKSVSCFANIYCNEKGKSENCRLDWAGRAIETRGEGT